MLNTNNIKRIVIKVGTSTLTYPTGRLNLGGIERLSRVICDLRNRDYEIVLVSSGAIGVGANNLNMKKRPTELDEKQAAAAIGQCKLMHIYDKFFLEYGHNVAQILLTKDDIDVPTRFSNIKNTFEALFRLGAIPIVNENDSVAVDEIVYGDNDTLSAVISRVCNADLLIILSDIDGLYDGDPRTCENAKLINEVNEITEDILKIAGGAGSENGTGGMVTKLQAASLCMEKSIPMALVNGQNPSVINDILNGKFLGTIFKVKEN